MSTQSANRLPRVGDRVQVDSSHAVIGGRRGEVVHQATNLSLVALDGDHYRTWVLTHYLIVERRPDIACSLGRRPVDPAIAGYETRWGSCATRETPVDVLSTSTGHTYL